MIYIGSLWSPHVLSPCVVGNMTGAMLGRYPSSHRGLGVRLSLASPEGTDISLSPYQAVLHRMSREVPWCRSVNAPCGRSGPRWDEYSPVSSASLARPLSFLRALSPHSPLILILDRFAHPYVTTHGVLRPPTHEVLTSFVFAGPLIRSQPAGKVLPPR